jgi:hypothetical protein
MPDVPDKSREKIRIRLKYILFEAYPLKNRAKGQLQFNLLDLPCRISHKAENKTSQIINQA